MLSLALPLLLSTTPDARAYGICPNVTWADLTDYAHGDFMEGGISSIGLGGKGDIDANDEITFDAYQNGAYLGSAEVDASGTLTLSGSVTGFEPLAVGWDCNTPSALRYFARAEVSGYSFYVIIYP